MTVIDPKDARLLVVDDEAVALRNLAHVFRKEGYQVVTRQSGGTALKELRNQPFDVVLTDLRMDRVDGMQVMREAKLLHPDCEVILIPGHGSLNSAVAAMKEGAFHYVAKPFRLDEVRQIVRSALDVFSFCMGGSAPSVSHRSPDVVQPSGCRGFSRRCSGCPTFHPSAL